MTTDKKYYQRFLGDGFSISNDTRVTMRNCNDIICGPSGSGKSGGIVYAQVKSLKDSSLIVADTKGRLGKMFRKELAEKNYNVLTLDLINPEASCVYNPMDYIRKNKNGTYKEQDIARLAAGLMPGSNLSHDPFWELSARNVLEFFIAFTLSALPEEDHNMYTVSRLFRSFIKTNGEAAFLPWIEAHPQSLAAIRYAQIQGMQNADKTLSSIYAFVTLALSFFDIEDYRYIFDPYYKQGYGNTGKKRKDGLDIAAIGRERTVLFLNLSDNDHSLDAITNVFYTQVFQTLISEADMNPDGALKLPVRMILDDFAAASGRIPDFDKIISVVRSRDIWLTICIQSFSQLETLYSKAQSLSIINNSDTIIYLGGNDLQSAEFIGTRANKTPEMILSMDRDKEYVLESGKPARLIRKIPPYSFEESDPETRCEDNYE